MKDQRLKTLKELEREIRKLRNEVEEIHAQVRDLTFDELGLDFSEKLGDNFSEE